MEVLIFLVVIVALIVVHELGHLIMAKVAGMRVDEFGIGYPPRAAKLAQRGETALTLNWLPFGGFVKIAGEDGGSSDPRAFSSKNRFLQALVLLAGIAMNLLAAYLLIALALMLGTPRALDPSEVASATSVELAVGSTLPGSPAAIAGLETADTIQSASDAAGKWSGSEAKEPGSFTDFVRASGGAPITLSIERAGKPLTLTIAAKQGISADDPSAYALGVDIEPIGLKKVPFFLALRQGIPLAWGVSKATAVGLVGFFVGVFTLHVDLTQVAGPVGIANALGGAARAGWGDLISLAAIISINLALINLLPIPALDGGRLLFVAIEAVIRRPLNPRIAGAINAAGFAFLILLMVVVTGHDLFLLL